MSVKMIVNKRRLESIIRNTGKKADDIVAEMAFMAEGYVDENWNTQSPAPPGEPPGIVTGALKNSKNVRRVRPGVWELTYGTDYGPHQEYGTKNMAAHPFLMPAVEWTTQRVNKQGVLTKIVED